MKAFLVNYEFSPTWLLESDLDYHIYDRSESKDWLKDFPQERITYTKNIGNIDYDKLSYLIDNYYNLPEVFLWGKTNLFKYVPEDQEFPSHYLPLLKQDHKTYRDENGVVCFYKDGMYYERNDSWYFWNMPSLYRNYPDFAQDFQLPSPAYLPFNPGGNFILTREKVLIYSRDYYEKMRSVLDHAILPAEAHCLERSYFTLWSLM